MPISRDWRKPCGLTGKNTWMNSRRLIWRSMTRIMRAGYAEKCASVDNAPRIDAGSEKERASQPSGQEFSDHVDLSAAHRAAAEETNRKPVGADAESDVSTARQIAVEVTSPEPPEVADAAVGPDEKKSEVDAVDADNLTEILDRLSQAPTPKTK
jgi:hypothetical protein